MDFSWYSLNRHELPGVLTEELKLSGQANADPYALKADIMLGANSSDRDGYPPFSVAVVGDSRKELFSWISTYAEELFPLTQFCRVCSIEDWTSLKLQFRQESIVGTVPPIWSSLVLGEMLGQADADTQVAGIPLARASACFSFALARTLLLYPNHEKARYWCTERLDIAERDPRFGRRRISVELVWKVWSVAISLKDVPNESLHVIETVLQVIAAIDKQAVSILATNQLLLSDSAEDRVEGFDLIADLLIEKLNSNALKRQTCVVTLAASAVLAGRGTSHIHLLAPTAKLFPEVLVWFGLFSGVLGPRSWDKAWRQQSKGVERILRSLFRPDDPVAADICWPEYEWLSKTYDSPGALGIIPKNTPRSLAIELLPGVTCQFRLAGQSTNVKTNDEDRSAEMHIRDEKSVITDNVLTQAMDLLDHVQYLLRPYARRPIQQSLFEENDYKKASQLTRRKSNVKTDKKPFK